MIAKLRERETKAPPLDCLQTVRALRRFRTIPRHGQLGDSIDQVWGMVEDSLDVRKLRVDASCVPSRPYWRMHVDEFVLSVLLTLLTDPQTPKASQTPCVANVLPRNRPHILVLRSTQILD